ncbi:MAG: hypothetical protein E3K40_07470 [Candidatus Brocadia sp.]|nr:hypothetical protein [Candidatus Brocadia sp.]
MFDIEFSRKAEKYYRSADEKTVRILNRCLEIIAKEPSFLFVCFVGKALLQRAAYLIWNQMWEI